MDFSCLPQTTEFSQIWEYLNAGIHQITQDLSLLSQSGYMNLWLTIYNFGLISRACALELQQKLKDFFSELISQQKATYTAPDVTDLLQDYLKNFQEYKIKVGKIHDLFSLYNRRWTNGGEVTNAEKILPIYSLAILQWKIQVFDFLQGDEKKLTAEILDLISKERSGEQVDETLIKNAITSFDEVNADYEKEFEAPLLAASVKYHQSELDDLRQSEHFQSTYLKKIQEKLKEEELRAKRYLPKKSQNKLMKTVFIHEHCRDLANALKENDDQEFRKMETILSRLDLPSSFRGIFQAEDHQEWKGLFESTSSNFAFQPPEDNFASAFTGGKKNKKKKGSVMGGPIQTIK